MIRKNEINLIVCDVFRGKNESSDLISFDDYNPRPRKRNRNSVLSRTVKLIEDSENPRNNIIKL